MLTILKGLATELPNIFVHNLHTRYENYLWRTLLERSQVQNFILRKPPHAELSNFRKPLATESYLSPNSLFCKQFHDTKGLSHNAKMTATSSQDSLVSFPHLTLAGQSLWSQMSLTASPTFWSVILDLLCTWRAFTNLYVLTTTQLSSTRITWNGVQTSFFKFFY